MKAIACGFNCFHPILHIDSYFSSWHYSLINMFLHMRLFYHSTSTLQHALISLKCMVNEHVFMNLVSLNKYFSPHLS